MVIRKFTEADRVNVLELLRLNTPAYFSPQEEADLIYYLDYHAQNYFVVEDHAGIMACGGYNLSEDESMGKLSWDLVHPNFQGQGYGRELTIFRISCLKKIASVKTLSVRTTQLVYRFYEKFGLVIVEQAKDFWAEGFDLFRMECAITAAKCSSPPASGILPFRK